MELKLPTSICSPADINRSLREINGLEHISIKTSQDKTTVALSSQLRNLAEQNGLDMAKGDDRQKLKSELQLLLKQAPILNISFAAEASQEIISKLISWLRVNIHANCLLEIGLQPSIAAGCVLRTPNKVFDMSLRRNLEGQESYLVELIQGAVSAKR